jgi:hypothetical protein
LEKLWDNVNAAVQRMGKADAAETEGVVTWDQEFAPWNAIAEAGQMGLIGFDANLVMVTLNPYFAEVSGIRTDLTGQTLAQVGDQAMISLVTEIKSTAGRSHLGRTEGATGTCPSVQKEGGVIGDSRQGLPIQ